MRRQKKAAHIYYLFQDLSGLKICSFRRVYAWLYG